MKEEVRFKIENVGECQLGRSGAEHLPTDQDQRTASAALIEQLAKDYRAPLMRHFIRRGLSTDVAEDCVQEVFVRIARVDLVAIEDSRAYLFTVASRVDIDRSRRLKARGGGNFLPIDNLLLPSEEPSPARVYEGRERLARLARILRELPYRTRDIFLLNRLNGLSYTQLAARYGVSVRSIEKRMTKALIHLRKRLSDDEKAR